MVPEGLCAHHTGHLEGGNLTGEYRRWSSALHSRRESGSEQYIQYHLEGLWVFSFGNYSFFRVAGLHHFSSLSKLPNLKDQFFYSGLEGAFNFRFLNDSLARKKTK